MAMYCLMDFCIREVSDFHHYLSALSKTAVLRVIRMVGCQTHVLSSIDDGRLQGTPRNRLIHLPAVLTID